MCWGFWVAAILEACLTGPLCMCQMASVIGQLCPVTFGLCVLIVYAGEQTLWSLSQHQKILSKKTLPFQNDPETAIHLYIYWEFRQLHKSKCSSVLCGSVDTDHSVTVNFILYLYCNQWCVFLFHSQIHVTSYALDFTLLAQLSGVMTCVAMTVQKMAILSLHFSMGCVLC